jgi:hypothetical protein
LQADALAVSAAFATIAAPADDVLQHRDLWTEETMTTDAATLEVLASRFIKTDSLPWIETTPGNKMKVIYHDPVSGMLTIIAKLEPGAGIPAHV